MYNNNPPAWRSLSSYGPPAPTATPATPTAAPAAVAPRRMSNPVVLSAYHLPGRELPELPRDTTGGPYTTTAARANSLPNNAPSAMTHAPPPTPVPAAYPLVHGEAENRVIYPAPPPPPPPPPPPQQAQIANGSVPPPSAPAVYPQAMPPQSFPYDPVYYTDNPYAVRQRKASRAQQACDQCRSRKAKCDEGRPTCSHCRDNGLICVYKDGPPQKYVCSRMSKFCRDI